MSDRPAKVRRPYTTLELIVNTLTTQLSLYGEVIPCGSFRRQSPMVGDLDFVLVRDDASLNFVALPVELEIHERGGSLAHCYHKVAEVNVDIYAVAPYELGAMLWYLTGPVDLNIAMRASAKAKGWTLNQKGLYDAEGNQLDDGTEQMIAKLLRWPWIPPAQRNDWEEFNQNPGNALEGKTVVSSDGSTFYTLTRYPSGEWSCTCKGYQFRRTCRHVKEQETE